MRRILKGIEIESDGIKYKLHKGNELITSSTDAYTMFKEEVLAGTRIEETDVPLVVVEKINAKLSKLIGYEPIAITYCNNDDGTVTIAFIARPKGGDHVWQFDVATRWIDLNFQSNKQAAIMNIGGDRFYFGVNVK